MSDLPKIKQKTKGIPESSDDNVVLSGSANRKGGKKSGKISFDDNGVLGSSRANNKNTATKTELDNKVAVFSTKNILINNVGKINKGYNIVSQAKADLLEKYDFTRIATPEEVAREYGL